MNYSANLPSTLRRGSGPFARGLLLAGLLCLLVSSTVYAGDDPASRRREFYDNLKIMSDVYERIINNYVDEEDPKAVMEAAVKGMLDRLDEHSNYLPPVNYEDLMMSTEGEFGGLGITINIRDHYPTVVSPIEGTPAYYMGIQGGDQIIEIEGESSRDFSSREAVKRLRGKPGSKVTITVARPGEDQPLPFTITRDIIKIESVPYAFMIDDIGYIRIQNFARTTRDELKQKLDELTAQGMRGLILDLRFNPGGLLDAAQGVSELFLEKDDLIVFTKGRLRSQNHSLLQRGPRQRLQQGADDRDDQRLVRLGQRDRRGRHPGPRRRSGRRPDLLRQGLGADRVPPGRGRGPQADHRPVLHAERPVHPQGPSAQPARGNG